MNQNKQKKFILKNIELVKDTNTEDTRKKTQLDSKESSELIQRLYDLGLYPGLEIEVVSKVSFNSVTIIQFGETRLALNEEEFSCLHGL